LGERRPKQSLNQAQPTFDDSQFNSTGEAQNMSSKRNKNKTHKAKTVLSLRSTLTNILQIT